MSTPFYSKYGGLSIMEMDAKRIGILKKLNITHYAIVVVVVLIFLQWFMPYFRYEPTGKKDTKTQTSMWGEILFGYNFKQLDSYMGDVLNAEDPSLKFKNITLRQLGAPVLMMVCGIIILCTMGKKGIATNVFPLIMGICGVKGYFFGNLIPRFCNVPASKIIGGILAVIMLVVTIVNIVLCVAEIKSRPADYYLPTLG